MKYFSYKYFLLCFILISGCDLFSTRSPEIPDTGRTKYQPPTSASIVISNFINSIIEKNSENYISCFSDTAQNNREYLFTPSSEAASQYPELFSYWDRSKELRAFNFMLAAIKEDNIPDITLTNDGWEILLPDSAVFYSDYLLTVPHDLQSTPNVFSGKLQFTLLPNNNQWSIIKWIDISVDSDTIKPSWSVLKASFSN
ncbi:hypothetical protein ACFLSQ_11905 [Bacteroidota bacterium]